MRIAKWTALAALGLGAYMLSAQAGGYHLFKKVPLGAAEGGGEYFDYITVDSAARRVYLSHGTEVKVLDADKTEVLGTITGLKRCHGIALVPELGRGFITDGDAGEAVIFDLKTFQRMGSVPADRDADSILYDPASKHIFVFNGEPKTATVELPCTCGYGRSALATLPAKPAYGYAMRFAAASAALRTEFVRARPYDCSRAGES